MIDFGIRAETFPGWIQPEEYPGWLHYFPAPRGVSLCGGYSAAPSERFYDLEPRTDLIQESDCCRGCLRVMQVRRGSPVSPELYGQDEAQRRWPASSRSSISGKSALAERIAEGIADPISDRERELAQNIRDLYEQRFGSKQTEKTKKTRKR